MPPKTSADEALKADSNVKILVELIRTATEFKADTSQMAAVCGLTAAKNVPRKINAIIAPYGLELKSGKLVSKDGSNGGKSGKSPESGKAPPMTPKIPKPNPSPKKRKIDHATAEEDGIEANDARMEGPVEDDAMKEEQVKGHIVEGEAVNAGPGMDEEGGMKEM